MNLSNNLSIQDSENILTFTSDIVENLDFRALEALMGGGEQDIDEILSIMEYEANSILAVPTKTLDVSRLDNLEPLIETLEETLRKESLNYFILSTMPDFYLNVHHLEWGNLTQLYNKLCIEAARGHGKSLKPDTEVLMYDGSTKRTDELKVGDKLMGPDSTPRIITALNGGVDKMYRVNQSRGNSYVVNSRHTLCTYKRWERTCNKKRGGHYKSVLPELVDMDIGDFMKLSEHAKGRYKGYKVCVEFPERELLLDPYYVGLWLGDGTRTTQNITTADKEIVDYLVGFCEKEDLNLTCSKNDISYRLAIKIRGAGKKNHIRELLRGYNLIDNKHIPNDYLINTKENRLKLLAGLIDSDGHTSGNQIEISMSNKSLVLDIQVLCHSLGFRTGYGEELSTCNGKKFKRYRLTISGELADQIPVLLERKKVLFNGKSNCLSRRPKFYSGDNQNYDISGVSVLSIEDIGEGEYISITVDGDRRFLLYDNTVLHNSFFFSKAYILWKLYRYQKDTTTMRAPKRFKESKEGMLITNEYKLANHLLGIVKEEIEENEILREKLYPENRRDGWGAEGIICANGAKVNAKSVGSKMRGFHPYWIVCDDYLNDQVLYSKEQNNKYINHFQSVTMNMIEPGGQVIVVGTPFREDDLYANLKESGTWKVFDYPAIYPDGRVLWPERHSLEMVLEKRREQGSMVFSREMLVRPISTESSLFPYPMLAKCFDKNLNIIPNINSSKKKYKKLVLSADFAISANIGADFSVFTVLGVTENDHYDILHIWRKQGATYDEQVSAIKRLYRDFRVDVVLVEDNGMQKVFVQMLNDAGVPATGQTTTAQKKYDLHSGIPHMAALFEQGRIHIPRGDQSSIDITDVLVGELQMFTWDDDKGKIAGVGAHDDTCMSLWIGICATQVGSFNFSFI